MTGWDERLKKESRIGESRVEFFMLCGNGRGREGMKERGGEGRKEGRGE